MHRMRGQLLDAPARWRDGTYRGATLAQTWKRFAPAMQRAGITRIAELTGLDTLGIPVFAAIRPLGKSLSTQQGKGLTADAARVSALMESLETWTAEELAVRRVRGSVKTLGARAVDVRRLPRALGRAGKPVAIDRDAVIEWVEGWDLVADAAVLVPVEAVTLDTTTVAITGRASADARRTASSRAASSAWAAGAASRATRRTATGRASSSRATSAAGGDVRPAVFDVSSNGLASGNSLVEAVLHGLCEVIERDAEARWRRDGGDRRVVLDTIPDRACRALIDRIAASGARVFVWDLRRGDGEDVELCSIGCAIVEDPREPMWRALGCYQGFGAHLEPAIAIARALTEAAQTRLTYIAGGRDDFFAEDYARATDVEVLKDLWQRLAQPCDEPVVYDDLPRVASRGLGDALANVIERVVAAGSEQVIAVDLTHPTLRVPVAKVIVPGRATDVEALG